LKTTFHQRDGSNYANRRIDQKSLVEKENGYHHLN
jgi:hypothetical protein